MRKRRGVYASDQDRRCDDEAKGSPLNRAFSTKLSVNCEKYKKGLCLFLNNHYNFHIPSLGYLNGYPRWKKPKYQQPNSHPKPTAMKNVNVKSSLKAGFSLVEMLVVIAIIGIIAAIAIPNIGSINDSARQATAQRNAQSVASVMNAAIAAGYVPSGLTDGASVITAAVQGVTPPSGPFKGKKFIVPNISTEDQAAAAVYLDYNATDAAVIYKADALSEAGSGTGTGGNNPPAGGTGGD